MPDLYKALGDISSVRKQVARSTEFRGYGPLTLSATAGMAWIAAGAQALWVPDPATHIRGYLAVWISTAVAATVLIGGQTITRTRRMHSGLADEMLHMAIEQFLPSVVAGLLITAVLYLYVPSSLWLLPGVWQVVFSLGVFSSCRFLPRRMMIAGAWYLMTGLICIGCGNARALSPWAMGISYGVGQLLVAGILFFNASDLPYAENADEN
jgi:hypothetical protein